MLGIHHVDANQPAQRTASPLTEVTMLENVNAFLKKENDHLLKSYKDLFNDFVEINTRADELWTTQTENKRLMKALEVQTQDFAKMVVEKDRWVSNAYRYKNALTTIQRYSHEAWTRECSCCQLTVHGYGTGLYECSRCGLFLSRG